MTRSPDMIARQLAQASVSYETAEKRSEYYMREMVRLAQELGPHMPRDVMTVSCEVDYQTIVLQLTREPNGEVLVEPLDHTPLRQVEWVELADPAPTLDPDDDNWHTCNPHVTPIDEEVA